MLARGVAFAVVGGLIGALAWGVIAYVTGWSFGIVAIVVGLLAGCGMGFGMKGRGSVGTGIASAIIALVCIVGAKFAVAVLESRDWAEEVRDVTEEDAVDAYASEVYDYYATTGQPMTLTDDEWPPEVLAEAQRLWGETPAHEREEYLAAMVKDADQLAEEGRLGASWVLFALAFGWINLGIMGIAVITAYKAGRRNPSEEAEAILATPDAPVQRASDGSDNGITGGPLSRPHHGGAAAAPPASKPSKKKKKGEEEYEDPHATGIFTRLGREEQAPPAPSAADAPAPQREAA